ncbi:GAF domain-containing protein [Oceanobacillus halotolerans]|uniref:GAF domain-containing protein n=1 Tax=Oceanobacillus halotolerans TaxID=2663380 RepID=UPI0013DBF1C7|nr:GAF domain-containing protein [Oceanobacillus halotolerans]
MFQVENYSGKKTDDYKLLLKQLEALSEGETDNTALLANASALLNQFLGQVNWVGFYIWKDNELVLGPFQGLPACIRIPYGKGVCGTAIKEQRTQRIKDVHQFPGHIACDSASNSEIVIPLIINNEIYGVLDIDSPITDRFDEIDQDYLEKFAAILISYIENKA